jgi:hypothetical protein
MDPDASRGELSPVRHEVVELACDPQGIGVEQRQILLARHREHVVHRLHSLLVLVPLEEREVRDPAQREHALVREPEPVSKMQPQPVQTLEDHRILVGDKECVVALLRPERVLQGFSLLGGEELGDRTRKTSVRDLEVGEAACPAGRRDGGQVVYLPARQVAQGPDGNAAHRSTGLDGAPEDLELALARDLRDVSDLQPEANVRLVRTEPVHRLAVGQARERILEDLLLGKAFHYLQVQALDEVEHFDLRGVAHLQVELGVLGLPIAALVLVAQGACDLKVPLESGDH